MNYFIEHVRALGFQEIMLLTVPPEVKPIYKQTIKLPRDTQKYGEVEQLN
jgi:hypothetical protein